MYGGDFVDRGGDSGVGEDVLRWRDVAGGEMEK